MILVTGGAGFIGSHLVEKLLEDGLEVRVIDNFSDFYSGKEKNVGEFEKNSNFELVRADIRDKNIGEQIRGAETIFHLAAQPGVGYSLKHPKEVVDINVGGTLNLLEAVRKEEVGQFVNVSSSSVYGNAKELPLREDMNASPISPYGASKLACEFYCRAYSEAYGMNTANLRYFTVYGPRQRPDMAIRKFVEGMMGGKAPTIFGDGNQTRDFTFVSDIVGGTALLRGKKFSGDVFNVGGGNRISVNELVETINSVLGKPLEPKYVDTQKGDVQDTWADISKISELGYKPQVGIKEGIEKFIGWAEKSE